MSTASVEAYAQTPPPIANDVCRLTEDCVEKGACTSSGDRCVAGSAADCRSATVCREHGQCLFDSERLRCDDGTEPDNRPMMIGGIVLSALGGASLIGGVVTLLLEAGNATCIDGLGPRSSCQRTDATLQTVGSVMMLAGVGLGLAGISLAVIGGKKVHREAPQLTVGPGELALGWTF